VNGEWFLFAFDHLRNDVRTFVPSRMQLVKPTGNKFVRPRKFSIAQRLRDSFGVHSGQGDFDVTIRFNEFAADYIREKRWHASQQLKELPGGGVELGLKLSSLGEVERWVLGWGGNAVVIEPAELVASVKRAAEMILKNTPPQAGV
jgi:predicted DNA-binding transcriptional regulator YafY